jgi:hypothetical protein
VGVCPLTCASRLGTLEANFTELRTKLDGIVAVVPSVHAAGIARDRSPWGTEFMTGKRGAAAWLQLASCVLTLGLWLVWLNDSLGHFISLAAGYFFVLSAALAVLATILLFAESAAARRLAMALDLVNGTPYVILGLAMICWAIRGELDLRGKKEEGWAGLAFIAITFYGAGFLSNGALLTAAGFLARHTEQTGPIRRPLGIAAAVYWGALLLLLPMEWWSFRRWFSYPNASAAQVDQQWVRLEHDARFPQATPGGRNVLEALESITTPYQGGLPGGPNHTPAVCQRDLDSDPPRRKALDRLEEWEVRGEGTAEILFDELDQHAFLSLGAYALACSAQVDMPLVTAALHLAWEDRRRSSLPQVNKGILLANLALKTAYSRGWDMRSSNFEKYRPTKDEMEVLLDREWISQYEKVEAKLRERRSMHGYVAAQDLGGPDSPPFIDVARELLLFRAVRSGLLGERAQQECGYESPQAPGKRIPNGVCRTRVPGYRSVILELPVRDFSDVQRLWSESIKAYDQLLVHGRAAP